MNLDKLTNGDWTGGLATGLVGQPNTPMPSDLLQPPDEPDVAS